MTGVEHNEGTVAKLDGLIFALSANFRLRLFKNNFTPARGNVLADFTEANFSGYGAVTPVFAASALDGNSNAKAQAGSYTFTHNGGGTANTIYGAYLVNIATGVVLESWKFGAPVSMAANGDNIVVTPAMYQGQIVTPL